MRIGNLDNSDNTGDLVKLIQSENTKNLTGAAKWKNWWHYYKWYVVLGLLLLIIGCDIIGNALGIFRKTPDFQIAYIGEQGLPQEMVTALEEAFAQLAVETSDTSSRTETGFDMDFNEDGQTYVRLNQYQSGTQSTDIDITYSKYASEITLIGDISACESYFFLMDNPERVQQDFQVLAMPDGSCPEETDSSTENKAILWSDCPTLCQISAVVEEKVPGSAAFLSNLYLGRRCFYSDTTSENADKCGELWDWIVNSR